MIAAILRHVNFDVVKCVLIASPGFTKDLFFDHMMAYAQKVAGGKYVGLNMRYYTQRNYCNFFPKICRPMVE